MISENGVEEYEMMQFVNPIHINKDFLAQKRIEFILNIIKKECIVPILQLPKIETILLKLPKFVFLYKGISIIVAKEIVKNPSMIGFIKDAIKESDVLTNLTNVGKKVFSKYISLSFYLLEKILKTKDEKLVYVNKYAMMEICEKSFLPALLMLCYEEAIKSENGVLLFLEKEMIAGMKEYILCVKALLKEWDILTDIVVMQEIEKSEKSIRDTGELPIGTKTFEEVMNGLGIKI